MNNYELRPAAPAEPLTFDDSRCIGCNRCLEACQIDVLLPATNMAPPLV